MTAPDPQTVREIAQEIILRQANYWNAAEIRQDYRTDPRCARLSDEDFTDVRDAVINAIVDATVTVSWPHEQPGVEQAAADHAMLLPWLAATRAEVERDHRPNAGILSTSCYCGCPEPCEDRAAKLAAIEGLRAALDRLAQLERALADVDMRFRLSHGGGWCATCRLPMREGTPVVKTLAVVCEPCAADLAATAGRLDPTRLAARKKWEATS